MTIATTDLTLVGARGHVELDLIGEPELVAELEHVYSAFRLRYSTGEVWEVTVTNHADAEDLALIRDVLPAGCVWFDTVDTDTMGVGHNGIVRERTHRYAA